MHFTSAITSLGHFFYQIKISEVKVLNCDFSFFFLQDVL